MRDQQRWHSYCMNAARCLHFKLPMIRQTLIFSFSFRGSVLVAAGSPGFREFGLEGSQILIQSQGTNLWRSAEGQQTDLNITDSRSDWLSQTNWGPFTYYGQKPAMPVLLAWGRFNGAWQHKPAEIRVDKNSTVEYNNESNAAKLIFLDVKRTDYGEWLYYQIDKETTYPQFS